MSEMEDKMEDQYENWKRNLPFMYDTAIMKQLTSPSLTVQWFRDVESDENGNEVHRLLIGSHNEDQECLRVLRVAIPQQVDDSLDYTLLQNIWKTQSVGVLHEEIVIPVEKEVNRAKIHLIENNIVAAHVDHKVQIFDLAQKKLVHSFEDQELEGYALAWNPTDTSMLLSGSYDHSTYIWDTTKQCINIIYRYHDLEVEDVAWMDANVFVSCSDDKTFAICDIRTQAGVVKRQKAHDDFVNCIALNKLKPDLFVTGSQDTQAKLFDFKRTDKELHEFQNHTEPINCVQWSPHQQNIFATGSQDGRIILWDIFKIGQEIKAEDEKDGPAELLFYHGGHRSKINELDFNTKNKDLIASVEEDNDILEVWKLQKFIFEKDEDDIFLIEQF